MLSITVITVENQIVDLSSNAHGKDMNPSVLILHWENENYDYKPASLRSRIDLVSHLVHVKVLYFVLRHGQKCHSKVMHRKEVTHSNGSNERKSRRRKLADEMGTSELHDSYFRLTTIQHAIPKIE